MCKKDESLLFRNGLLSMFLTEIEGKQQLVHQNL